MCIDHIKEAAKLAWKNFYGLKSSSKTTDQQSFTALEEMTNTSVKWVGHVTISNKSGNYTY